MSRSYFRYTKEILEEAVSNSVSYAGVLRYLGKDQAGGTQCHVKNMIEKFDIDTAHFTGKGHNKGKLSNKRKTANDILIVSKSPYRSKPDQLRRALKEIGIEEKCVECGVGTEYNERKLVLEVDHINGDWKNNLPENLRFLCPNCHSQTATHSIKNP